MAKSVGETLTVYVWSCSREIIWSHGVDIIGLDQRMLLDFIDQL